MDDIVPPMTWLGFVLIGLAVVMTLLDWGELSDLAHHPAPRRRWAGVVALVGLALVLLSGLAAVLAD